MTGGFRRDDLSEDEVARLAALYGPFTAAVRDLADATIRTMVDDDEIRRAQAEIEAVTARLRARQLPGSHGVSFSEGGRGRPWGNAVVGLRNPVAPPLVTEHHPSADGRVWCDFHLGAAYEGPPTLVHGGVLALVLDQMLGESAGAGGRPGMTGTLTSSTARARPSATCAPRPGSTAPRASRPGPRATSSDPTASPSRPRASSSSPSGPASGSPPGRPARRRSSSSSPPSLAELRCRWSSSHLAGRACRDPLCHSPSGRWPRAYQAGSRRQGRRCAAASRLAPLVLDPEPLPA